MFCWYPAISQQPFGSPRCCQCSHLISHAELRCRNHTYNSQQYPPKAQWKWMWIYWDGSKQLSSHHILKRGYLLADGWWDYRFLYINNNPDFGQKHAGVPVGTDGTKGTSYLLEEHLTHPVVKAACHIAYWPAFVCVCNVVIYTYHVKGMSVTLFTGAFVMLSLFTQPLAMFLIFVDESPDFSSLLLRYIGWHTLCIYV